MHDDFDELKDMSMYNIIVEHVSWW